MDYTIKKIDDNLWKQFKSKLALEDEKITILEALKRFIQMYVNGNIKL